MVLKGLSSCAFISEVSLRLGDRQSGCSTLFYCSLKRLFDFHLWEGDYFPARCFIILGHKTPTHSPNEMAMARGEGCFAILITEEQPRLTAMQPGSGEIIFYSCTPL